MITDFQSSATTMARTVKLEPPSSPPPDDDNASAGAAVDDDDDDHDESIRKLLNVKAAINDDEEEYYDPRNLRTQYRQLKKLIVDGKDDVGSPDCDRFKTIINEVESLHKIVQKPREQVADAEALLDIMDSLFSSVKSHGNNGVTPADFVSCLLRDFGDPIGSSRNRSRAVGGGRTVRWNDVGALVSPFFSTCRGCRTMIGPMDAQSKVRKVGVRRGRTQTKAKKAQPEEVGDGGARENTDTDSNMVVMFDILRNKKVVKLEHLVLNRNSFAQTVENLFTLSFLVKDGRAQINVNENGWHLVSPKNAPLASSIASGEVAYRHFVFRLDFKDWQLMKQCVGVGQELMQHRNQADDLSGTSQPDSSPIGGSQEPALSSPYQSDQLDSQEAGVVPPIRKYSRKRGLIFQDETEEDLFISEIARDEVAKRAIRSGKRVEVMTDDAVEDVG